MLSQVLAAFCLLLPHPADDPVFSGPQPGEMLPAFEFTAVESKDGPERTLDPVRQADNKPLVLVFVHERSRPAFGLANVVMRLVASRDRDKISGALVYLAADPTEATTWMNRVRSYFPEGVARGIFKGGLEGPGAYGLNRNVAITILVANEGKVTANYALVQPSLQADAPKIFASIAAVLGEKEVPDVAKFSPNGMRGNNARNRNMRNRGDQNAVNDGELRSLMQPLIQKTATVEQVDEAAEKIEAAVKKNPALKQRIGDIARRIIAAERLEQYGTERCQHYLKKWAREFGKPAADGSDPKRSDDAPKRSDGKASGKSESDQTDSTE